VDPWGVYRRGLIVWFCSLWMEIEGPVLISYVGVSFSIGL
jgi:hypothetical protein